MADTITVIYGEQTFSPVSFHSFRIGGTSMTTEIKPDETPEQAYQRAYDFLEQQARNQFKHASQSFAKRQRMAVLEMKGEIAHYDKQ